MLHMHADEGISLLQCYKALSLKQLFQLAHDGVRPIAGRSFIGRLLTCAAFLIFAAAGAGIVFYQFSWQFL